MAVTCDPNFPCWWVLPLTSFQEIMRMSVAHSRSASGISGKALGCVPSISQRRESKEHNDRKVPKRSQHLQPCICCSCHSSVPGLPVQLEAQTTQLKQCAVLRGVPWPPHQQIELEFVAPRAQRCSPPHVHLDIGAA